MYNEFYNFQQAPFALACQPRLYFASQAHSEALASMVYCVQQRKGMVLVTGQVGAGKTFVAHMLAARLGPSVHTVVLRHPPKTPKNLLRAIAAGIGLALPGSIDAHSLQQELLEHLLRLHRRGRQVCLVIDECQDLSPAAMEEIRLLWNWETHAQRLVQIVLIGQPELRELLCQPKWESLRQRIVLSFHLQGLDRADVCKYIQHRLDLASQGNARVEFTPEAVEQITGASNGVPRLINTLCDNSLLVGYNRQVRIIDAEIVRIVINDMTCWGLNSEAENAEKLTSSLSGECRG
ncbi:MAG: ExeA family protein [Phycisphaerae bacterium]